MIRSFASKATAEVLEGSGARSLAPDIQDRVRWKLRMLNNASVFQDLRIPPNDQLEKFSGKRSEQFSIRVNRQWRVCFRWDDGDAYDVEVVDYH